MLLVGHKNHSNWKYSRRESVNILTVYKWFAKVTSFELWLDEDELFESENIYSCWVVCSRRTVNAQLFSSQLLIGGSKTLVWLPDVEVKPHFHSQPRHHCRVQCRDHTDLSRVRPRRDWVFLIDEVVFICRFSHHFSPFCFPHNGADDAVRPHCLFTFTSA